MNNKSAIELTVAWWRRERPAGLKKSATLFEKALAEVAKAQAADAAGPTEESAKALNAALDRLLAVGKHVLAEARGLAKAASDKDAKKDLENTVAVMGKPLTRAVAQRRPAVLQPEPKPEPEPTPEDEDDPGALVDPEAHAAYLQKIAAKLKRGTLNFALAMPSKNPADLRMQFHRSKAPRTLASQLKSALKPSRFTFGSAGSRALAAEHGEDVSGRTLVLTLEGNKIPNLAKAVKQMLRKLGVSAFGHVVIVDDGATEADTPDGFSIDDRTAEAIEPRRPAPTPPSTGTTELEGDTLTLERPMKAPTPDPFFRAKDAYARAHGTLSLMMPDFPRDMRQRVMEAMQRCTAALRQNPAAAEAAAADLLALIPTPEDEVLLKRWAKLPEHVRALFDSPRNGLPMTPDTLAKLLEFAPALAQFSTERLAGFWPTIDPEDATPAIGATYLRDALDDYLDAEARGLRTKLATCAAEIDTLERSVPGARIAELAGLHRQAGEALAIGDLKTAEALLATVEKGIGEWSLSEGSHRVLDGSAEAIADAVVEGFWPWDPDMQVGGKELVEALSSSTCDLTERARHALVSKVLERWKDGKNQHNIWDAVVQAKKSGDAELQILLASGFARALADDIGDGGFGFDTPRQWVEQTMLANSVELDRAAAFAAFDGKEELLAKALNGRRRVPMGLDQWGNPRLVDGGYTPECLAKFLKASAANAKADRLGSLAFVQTMLAGGKPENLETEAYRKAMVDAIVAAKVGPPLDPEAVRASLDALTKTSGGRDLLLNAQVDPTMRDWALQQVIETADWSTDALAEGWESDLVGQGISNGALKEARKRFEQPVVFPTTSEAGKQALCNALGLLLGLPANDLPSSQERLQKRAARLKQGLSHAYYDPEEPPLKGILEHIAADTASADAAPHISAIPIAWASSEYGTAVFKLIRLETCGGPIFFDAKGNRYDSVTLWEERNELPPGRLTYPEELDLENGPVTIDSPANSGWVWFIDSAVMVIGTVAGIVAIAGSGGTAAPIVTAVAGLYGTGRASYDLYDKSLKGHSLLNVADPEIRTLLLQAGTGLLSIGSIGGSLRAGQLLKHEAQMSRACANVVAGMTVGGSLLDAAAMADGIVQLSRFWPKLTPEQKATALLQLSFVAGLQAASLKSSGGRFRDQFSFRRARNQLEHGSPYDLVLEPKAKDLEPGQVAVRYDPADKTHPYPRNFRIVCKGTSRPSQDQIALHSRAAAGMEASVGLRQRIADLMGGEKAVVPGTRGWEAHHEIKKIGREMEVVLQQLNSGKAGRLKQLTLKARLDELNMGLVKYKKRVDDFHTKGVGYVAAPPNNSEAIAKAKELGWPIEPEKMPKGYQIGFDDKGRLAYVPEQGTVPCQYWHKEGGIQFHSDDKVGDHWDQLENCKPYYEVIAEFRQNQTAKGNTITDSKNGPGCVAAIIDENVYVGHNVNMHQKGGKMYDFVANPSRHPMLNQIVETYKSDGSFLKHAEAQSLLKAALDSNNRFTRLAGKEVTMVVDKKTCKNYCMKDLPLLMRELQIEKLNIFHGPIKDQIVFNKESGCYDYVRLEYNAKSNQETRTQKSRYPDCVSKTQRLVKINGEWVETND